MDREPTTLPSIADVRNVAGKYVLVRASLNVPVKDGVVQNIFRLKRLLPTIEYLRAHGARTILIGHIGRKPEESLAPVYRALAQMTDLTWCPELLGETAQRMRHELSDGEVRMLENVRSHPGEEANDPTFAAALASSIDIYVNDAFDAAHRTQASLVGIPAHVPSYFGINFVREYEALVGAQYPQSPSLFILGGAKFETKLPLVAAYLERYDHVFVGGALAHDIWKAQGYEVGTSLTSDIDLSGHPLVEDARLLLPTDVVVVGTDGAERTITPDEVLPTDRILDAGPATIGMLATHAHNARTILWNGPLGNYEFGHVAGTEGCAEMVAASDAFSIVGGGDTIASIESLCLSDRFGFLSTAGGAMLSFLEHGTLPAIDAIIQKG